MSPHPFLPISFLTRCAIGLMRVLMRPLVKVQVIGTEALTARLDRGSPVCWSLQFSQLSSLVVLDDQARRFGLPLPLAPMVAAAASDDTAFARIDRHAFFYLTRRGQPSPLSNHPYAYSPRLLRMVCAVRADPSVDVQIVPVHVFWGREPRRQESVLRALLAEGWVIPGRLRQMLRVFIHGRQTLLQFGEPMSLRTLIEGAQTDSLALRRAARRLRAEFRLERERVIGPDPSHRHTLINAVIASTQVQQAITEQANETGRSLVRDRIEARARRDAWDIASNYSYPFIRAFDLLLQLLWRRIYDGISTHRFDELRAIDPKATRVYLPCHRSHFDYLLLSYLIHEHGLAPPHVAAGANLNIPVIGGLLRRGGAFFMRRSFKGDPLYSAVFAGYLGEMIGRGFPIEYFVEGGRSRTGRMLSPRAGLIAMTVESWQRNAGRPLVFVPIYIGYERLFEGESYVAELSGRPKARESLIGLIRSLRRLREHFGQVHVSIGETIDMQTFMQSHGVDADALSDERSARTAIDRLALEVVTRINDAAVINPVNLVSVALLGAPRLTMDVSELMRQIDLLREILHRVPYSMRIEVTAMPGVEVVMQAERTGLLHRITHPLGDLLQVAPHKAPGLAYFRNNVLHVWALPALVATLLSSQPGLDSARLQDIVQRVFPFIRAAYFVSLPIEQLETHVGAIRAAFESLELTGGPVGGSGSAALQTLAQLMRQPLQRYFITLAVLSGQGSGTLSSDSLETIAQLVAQRMAFLYETDSPEYFDRSEFRSIIATLVGLGWVSQLDGRLVFGDSLREAAGDSPWLLSAEVRRAIAQVTRLPPA